MKGTMAMAMVLEFLKPRMLQWLGFIIGTDALVVFSLPSEWGFVMRCEWATRIVGTQMRSHAHTHTHARALHISLDPCAHTPVHTPLRTDPCTHQ